MRRPARVRGWREMREEHARLLERRTGEGVERWNRRIREARVSSPDALRAWLAERGVTGYARDLLVRERIGYPDFMLASARALIDAPYADRPHLRPIFDEIVSAAATLGGRLKPSRLHEGMPVGIPLASAGDVDAETRLWLQRAYAANA